MESFEVEKSPDFFPAAKPELSLDPRLKSSLRLQYEAQVRVIQTQIGGLEKARETLGLSQRKISQLLLVDPSAWTRWTRDGEKAPPHIWRSLQWYLTLKEKIPGLTPQYFLQSDPKVLHEKTLIKMESESRERKALTSQFQDEIRHLQAETLRLKRWNQVFIGGFVVCAVVLGMVLRFR